MSFLRQKTGDRTRAFIRNEEGSVTLEFLLWFPLVVFLFLAILDFAYAFTLNASMWQQTRVAARAMSMHELSKVEAEQFIRDGLSWSGKNFDVNISETKRTVSVSIKTPYEKAGITNTALRMMSGDWESRVTMLREPV
ncbi:hypothetical protein GLS40_06930 [Pseudooceanicola sp. 216_PA32_1]|uniref:TadE-like domain-containing protein n=1 Tax=Pseudooceanicola pacificus TaxID=2676438 RepID=A0A844WA22_9RHOB|nr:TadE family protein [Pseudooceanicola pacificus]MWB77753.1 hypothetical protein [Pseudooceanicola pacificus]